MLDQLPELDDRSFDELLEQARRHLSQSCPDWTDLSPNDPGMALLEVFAHLTETMIYRLNRIPEKVYVELLKLMGLRIHPPVAATVKLRFSRSRPSSTAIEIPRGTRVTSARAASDEEAVSFVTQQTVTVDPGESWVEALAFHGELVEAELVGVGTGLPGLSVTVNRLPIIAAMEDEADLIVGVEATPGELEVDAPAREHDAKFYRIWREVQNFTNARSDRFVYTVDRFTGTITFAPALRLPAEDGALQELCEALAEVPAAGREIRVWYRRGGGAQGNLGANTLSVLDDFVAGVEVTNPTPASGGRSAESLAHALHRGPQNLHALERVVTARDYERLASTTSGAVTRAKAFTKNLLWDYAPPGTVEVMLVPHVPDVQLVDGPLSAEMLHEQETQTALMQIQNVLDSRRPLGTACVVNWVRYKSVRVTMRIKVFKQENRGSVKQRILNRLYQTINPIPIAPDASGWPFGRALTSWDIYKIAGTEAGVSAVEQVSLCVDDVPGRSVKSVCASAFQSRTWFAGSADAVFRSINDGAGWERVLRVPGEQVDLIKAFPKEAGTAREYAGLVAMISRLSDADSRSRLYFSRDCGETWEAGPQTKFSVEDMAWMERGGVAMLLLATESGLYEILAQCDAVPKQVLVDPDDQKLGFYAVAVSRGMSGDTSVAVAARQERGVFLSSSGGKANTYEAIGLDGELVRVLAVQHRGPNCYMWAGIAAPGSDPGKGCFRWRLTGSEENPEGWRAFRNSWEAGGCRGLAFQGSNVLAASLRRGVLRLDADQRDPVWESPDVRCGLPLEKVGELHPIDTVATDPAARLLMAGGIQGVYRSSDHGIHYHHCSKQEFTDKVTLPESWLFCSGKHEVEVVSHNEQE